MSLNREAATNIRAAVDALGAITPTIGHARYYRLLQDLVGIAHVLDLEAAPARVADIAIAPVERGRFASGTVRVGRRLVVAETRQRKAA